MKRASIWTIFAFLVILAGPSLVMGGPPTKPVEIVDQPVDVNLVNTEPILVKIDMADVNGAGISVFKEGTCEVSTQQDLCQILMYTVPIGEIFIATHLFVEVVNNNLVACILEDSTTKACLPSSQWTGPMPASIAFTGGSEVKVQLRYPIGEPGCSNGGCPETYRITLMGNLM